MTAATERLFGAAFLSHLRQMAERAASAGENTFAIPEAAPVADFVARMVQPGPLRTDAKHWLGAGASYHALVRLTAHAATNMSGIEPAGSSVYVPKVAGELEPLLSLWPAVIALPTTLAFEPLDLEHLPEPVIIAFGPAETR